MGWRTTRQVSSDNDDGSGWTQSSLQEHRLLPMKKEHPQQQSTTATTISSSEQVKCPRCGSADTKFCYYNNYNKSQPRHLCKTCKRHWTKGGSLRNVPVGGGRKNNWPRNKKSPYLTSMTVSDTVSAGEKVNERKEHEAIFSELSPLPEPTFHGASSAADCSVLQQELDDQFPWPGFEVSSWQHTIPKGGATMPTSLTCHQPWTFTRDCPETAGNCMNWDELDMLVSANLNFHWVDLDIKLP